MHCRKVKQTSHELELTVITTTTERSISSHYVISAPIIGSNWQVSTCQNVSLCVMLLLLMCTFCAAFNGPNSRSCLSHLTVEYAKGLCDSLFEQNLQGNRP